MSRILRTLSLYKTFQQSHFCENLPTLTFNPALRNEDDFGQLFGPITLSIEALKYLKNSIDKAPLKLQLPKQSQYHAFLAPHAFHYEDILRKYHPSDVGYNVTFMDGNPGVIDEEIYKGVLYTAKQHTPYAFLAFTLRCKQSNNDIGLVLELYDLHVNPSDQHPDDWVLLSAILCYFMDIVLEGITRQTTRDSQLSVSLSSTKLIPNKVFEAIKLEVGNSLRNLHNAYPFSAQLTSRASLDHDHDHDH